MEVGHSDRQELLPLNAMVSRGWGTVMDSYTRLDKHFWLGSDTLSHMLGASWVPPPQHSSQSRSKGMEVFGAEQEALWRYFNLHLLLPWRNWGSLYQLVGENQGKVPSFKRPGLSQTPGKHCLWVQGNLRKTVLGNLIYATNTHLIQSVFISALQLYFKECFCWMMCYWLVDR